MSYEVGYVDGLQGTWVAEPIPVSNAPIAPYSTAPTGGFAYQAPVNWQPAVGSPTRVLAPDLDSMTYTTPTGARAWRATDAENALVDAVTRDPYSGLDELVEAGGRSVGSKGVQALPYVGDIVGGVVDGAIVYGETGSAAQGIGAGVGSTAGGIAGSAVGGAIGAVGGPVGVLAGGIIGGAVGSAIGGALGQALGNLIDGPPSHNKNGAEIPGDYPYANENNDGQLFQIYWQYKYEGGNWTDGSWVGVADVYPYRSGGGDSTGCPNGSSFRFYDMGRWGLASGCGAQIRNVRMAPWPTVTGKPVTPVVLPEPSAPTAPLPRVPTIPGIPLPSPRFPNLPEFPGFPTPKPTPTTRPTDQPTGKPTGQPRPTPFNYPQPVTGTPQFPDFGQPGNQPTSKPHPEPNPNPITRPPNPIEPPTETPDDCDPCSKIDDIKQKLEETFSLQWSLPNCESESDLELQRTGKKEGSGLTGISQKIDALYQVLKILHDNTRCSNASDLALPESWAIKTARTTGQYVITWKPTDGSRSRWSSTIPHPKFVERSIAYSQIDNITFNRGDVMLNIQNRDNSQCIFNVASRGEADRVSNWALNLLSDSYAESANIKVTEGLRPRIAPREVQIANIKYFPSGQNNLIPAWIIRFDENGNKLRD